MFNQSTETTVFSSRMSDPVRRADYLEVQLCDHESLLRTSSEKFVQDIFSRVYEAQISSFYPQLITIIRQDNSFAAVAGVRAAETEELFLEHYLDSPIEQILLTPRRNIIEIGNLAPSDAGQARWLIVTLNTFMVSAGFTHVVFTAVPRLRNAFRRMGLPLTELADATADHLSEQERQDWGHYYDDNPVVCVGDLRVGESSLDRVAKTDRSLEDLCQRTALLGRKFRAHLDHESSELVT